MRPASEHYIREKLNTRNPCVNEAVREAMTEEVPAEARYAVLEHDLRIVVALLRDAQTLNPTQLQQVSAFLEPLWDYQSAKH
jgi:hypothetical protein